MMALAVSGVSTGWFTGDPATAEGLCETVTIYGLAYLLSVVHGTDSVLAVDARLRTSVATCLAQEGANPTLRTHLVARCSVRRFSWTSLRCGERLTNGAPQAGVFWCRSLSYGGDGLTRGLDPTTRLSQSASPPG